MTEETQFELPITENPDSNAEPKLSFEQEIENEIIAKGLTAPRVTKAEIDELLARCVPSFGKVSDTRVLCQLTLDGFTIADGFSACVSKENFDLNLGCKLAYQKAAYAARNKLWELEGYRLNRELNKNAGGETASTILTENN